MWNSTAHWECWTNCLKTMPEVAQLQELTFYAHYLSYWTAFFVFLHILLEFASTRWNKTLIEKPRDI
jgi:hypothetical protein